ncbi:MAG: glycerol-3-phosphate dehydrogenase/oxidase [Persicimonas sp.]
MTIGTADNPYDLIIIGGGINGAGIARDAVMRGLSVALFEKNDYSTGATWASSGMIHGGVRYLDKDPTVTKKSSYDSGLIQQIAPHLLFRVPFLFPVRENTFSNRVLLELAEVYFDTYDRYAPMKGGVPHSRLTAAEARAVEPGLPEDVIGAVTTDEWGIDSPRLNFINILDAAERGADVHHYHQVVDFLFDDGSEQRRGAMRGVRVRDRLGGETRRVYGRITFNATGAWSERVARSAGAKMCRVRPGKGIHLVLAGRIGNYALITEAIDGRQIFVAPHQNVSFVGTTDDDYFGDLDDIPVLEDEVEYLLNGVRRVFPSIDDYRIIDTMVGCRPTLYDDRVYESDLSREHRVFDHSEEGIDNFMSIAGGKLAAYRLMSEEAVDRICEKLGVDEACTTSEEPLPGGAEHDLTTEPFEELGLDAYAAGRLLYRHGSRSHKILDLMRQRPHTTALVDRSEPVTEAELRYVMRHEMVSRLDDCKRRARLGQGLDGGWGSTLRAAEIFCDEKDLPRSERFEVALAFQRERFEDRRHILRDEQLAAEAVGHAWFFQASGAKVASNDALLNDPDDVSRDPSYADNAPSSRESA